MKKYICIIFLFIVVFIAARCLFASNVIIEYIKSIISKDIKNYPIDQFIADCLNSTNQLKISIESLLNAGNTKIDKNELDLIKNNIDLIVSQIEVLKKIKDVEPSISIYNLKEEKPPYTIELFKRYITSLREINLSISENKNLNEDIEDKLEAVEKNCKNLTDDYLKEEQNLSILQKYIKLTSILSLKIQNMILYKKQKNYQIIIEKLKKQKEELTEKINYIFKNLSITQLDIKKIKNKKESLASQLEFKKTKILEKQRDIDKKIIYYEIELQSLQNKINSNTSNLRKGLLKLDEKRIKSIINYYNFKKLYLFQDLLSTELKKKYYDFYYLWLVGYNNIKNGITNDTFFKSIGDIIDDVEHKLNLLIEKLADIRKAKIDLEQSLAVNSQEIKNLKDKKMKQAIYNLNYELKRQSKLIDDIIFILIQNKHTCSEFLNEAYLISTLLKKMFGLVGSLNVWSKEKFMMLYEKIKFVVFYPFVTIGNMQLSIAIIFKMLFIFSVGLFGLRRARKKISSIMQEKTSSSEGTINSITTLGYYFSLVLLVVIVLSTAGIDLSQLSILMGALGVGIGFGLQTIANNFISGLIILSDRSVQIGDIVELPDGTVGKVKNLAIRATVIRTYDGQDIIVPNSEFISARVKTWTYSDDWRRLTIPFGVSYDADPELVTQIAIEAAREVPITREDDDHPILVWFEGFGDNSINFSLKVWCRINELNEVKAGLMSDYYFMLFKKLKEANIEIPFPQRDVYLKSLPESVIDLLKKEKTNKNE